MEAVKALVSLCIYAGSFEHSLLDNAISTKLSCANIYVREMLLNLEHQLLAKKA